MEPASVGTLIECVLPHAEILTPNIPEAQYSQMQIRTPADMEEAARRIHAMGCKNVLVKGGKNMAGAVDVLYDKVPLAAMSWSRSTPAARTARDARCRSAIASNLALDLHPGSR